ARPDEHVPDEAVMPGDVDEVDLIAVGQAEVRVPDVDRHAAPPLFGQPVGVDPRQRPEERRLAMVDVARSADDDGHGRLSAAVVACEAAVRSDARSAFTSTASSSGSTVRRSSTTARSRIRAITGGSPARSAAATRSAEMGRPAGPTPSRTPADGSVSPGSDPPPTVDSTSTTDTPGSSMAAPRASARARSSPKEAAIIRHTGISAVALPAR